ncbi:MAG: hypothetical protein FJ286_10515 [Planctomycetes bacterium]|nr:hypothetical protein [Planctomycetota bacterium]
MAGEIDFLGIHFLGPERFRARETTVNRLLRRIRTAIVTGRGKRPARQRYFRACRRINELFGYELTGRPTRCRIGKVRYVQPRSRGLGVWRVRSAARMYEMEVGAIADVRPCGSKPSYRLDQDFLGRPESRFAMAVGSLIQLLACLWRLPERPSLLALPPPSILGNPVDISTETPRYLAASFVNLFDDGIRRLLHRVPR